ncbi:ankyrin repeat and zinc finger domain-containing protein 1 [Syngnathus acus]|uniref:ankyrin repeat and zinc finger domain-containing protein 1 n=1 Tax=Syngnathus acus TaxID=161584 RepID=UPI001885E812|nr:ankyrin repeat and zinc finger domain-containing protein 1 [Syngnathus acus]XP_037136632.1 ankyrin repeat and zinc finger domain-containing protein 1 [Syngnathus acus]
MVFDMNPASPNHCSIFDLSSKDEAFTGLREVNPILKESANREPALEKLEDKASEDVREISDKMACSACRCSFINREEQMEHYKLDWHRFNLRLKMSGKPPVTTEEFERKTGIGDMSSISGSESDDEESDKDEGETDWSAAGGDNDNSDDSSLMTRRFSSKVLFQDSAGHYLSVYRCILHGKSNEEQDLESCLKSITKRTMWIILMTGGGHFAGGVFQGKEVLQHKTFHRYTVRAKRGTAQGLKDSQNRSHTPKSAGAALRRYNEAALVKDIQDLLMNWGDHLKEASAIFIRAPSYIKTIFFGGRTSPLEKKDGRIRSIPFPTRRATFREVHRVHSVLSTVDVYGKDTDLSTFSSVSKKAWKKTVQPAAPPRTEQEEEDIQSSSDEEEGGGIQLEMVELTIGTQDLKEFDIQPSRHNRRRWRRRRKKEEEEEEDKHEEDAGELSNTEADDINVEADTPQQTQPKNKSRRKKQAEEAPEDSWDYSLRDALFTACKVGDVDALGRLLRLSEEPRKTLVDKPADTRIPLTLLNKHIDSSGFTLLHVASVAAQKAAVRLLLDAGADPACSDKKGQTPYNVSPDKDTRNVFRKYMGEHPDKYDYNKARVPGPLTSEIESMKTEKKKAQKALKKQREKTLKEEKRKQEMEEEEKKKFASLSDREKRALAAERRLAEQVAATGVSLSNVKRCFQCGESLLGKIPFQYLDFSFCTPRCVQAHRKANAPAGKS